jgi:hypothetical protein
MNTTTITDRLPIETVTDTVVDTAQRLADLVPDGVPDTVQDVVSEGVAQGRRYGRRVTGRSDSSRSWLVTAGIVALVGVVAMIVWKKRSSDRRLTGVNPDDWATGNSTTGRSVA